LNSVAAEKSMRIHRHDALVEQVVIDAVEVGVNVNIGLVCRCSLAHDKHTVPYECSSRVQTHICLFILTGEQVLLTVLNCFAGTWSELLISTLLCLYNFAARFLSG
jgi:hypothetical protein